MVQYLNLCTFGVIYIIYIIGGGVWNCELICASISASNCYTLQT